MSEAEAQRLDELEAVRLRQGDGAIDGSWKVQSPASISLAIVKDRLEAGRRVYRRVAPGFVGGGRVEVTIAAQLVEKDEDTVILDDSNGGCVLDFEPTVGHAGQWVVAGDGEGHWEVDISIRLLRKGAAVTADEDMAMLMLEAGIVNPVSYWGTTRRTATWSGKGKGRGGRVGQGNGRVSGEPHGSGAELDAPGSDAATAYCGQLDGAEDAMRTAELAVMGVADAAGGCRPSEAEGHPEVPVLPFNWVLEMQRHVLDPQKDHGPTRENGSDQAIFN
jgi:hypothetical protein